MPAIGPVCTAMVTPFTASGELDLDGAQRLADHLVSHGTDTVLVHGTTGESPTIWDDEMIPLLEAVIEAVGDRGNVMMGTGSNNTAKALKSTRLATEAGADAVLVVTPYYNKPSQRALLRYFTDVAEATHLPVVMYDIPGRTSREIALDTIVELASVPNIVALKDAAGDLGKAADVMSRTRDVEGGFDLYSGSDELNLPFLSLGAHGVVSVSAHLCGEQLAEMIEVFPKDPARARDLHLSLMPLHRALFAEPSPGPLKGALNRLGLPAGPVRGPLVDAEDATVDAVLAAMDHAGIARP